MPRPLHQNSPLRTLPKDKRDFKLGSVFKVPKLSEIPAGDWIVAEPLAIKNQLDRAGSFDDLCTAYASSSVAEDHEGVLLDPGYTFGKIKQIEGDPTTYGSDLRTASKAAKDYGFLEASKNPFPDKNRDFVANWKNWPALYDQYSANHKQRSYFAITGPYDLFDNIRAALWQFRDKKSTVLAGSYWYPEFQHAPGGVIPKKYGGLPSGHAFKVFGQRTINREPYLVAQNSYGDKVGDKGRLYFSREVVNKEWGAFGSYMFVDIDPEEVRRAQISIMERLVDLYKQLIALLTPKPAPKPEPTPEPKPEPKPKQVINFTMLADAIREHEGWFPGSRSFRNNNPGNLRSPIKGRPSAYLDSLRAYAVDDKNFCKFHSAADGMTALVHFLSDAAAGKLRPYKTVTDLVSFFSVYAPASDNNDPNAYAKAVARKLGIPLTTKLSEFQRS